MALILQGKQQLQTEILQRRDAAYQSADDNNQKQIISMHGNRYAQMLDILDYVKLDTGKVYDVTEVKPVSIKDKLAAVITNPAVTLVLSGCALGEFP